MVRPYTVGKPFRFWCQKILPLVYDDSLSYYELLNKVVDYLNKVINNVDSIGEAFNELGGQFESLQSSFNELSKMVDNYFDNLDVQQEINNKLDAMAKDGTLDALIQPLVDSSVSETVSEWLKENVTPTGSAVVVDSSLTVSGASADAKVTGDEIRDLKSDLNDIAESEDNHITPIWDSVSISNSTSGSLTVNSTDGTISVVTGGANHNLSIPITLEVGKTYSVSFSITNQMTSAGVYKYRSIEPPVADLIQSLTYADGKYTASFTAPTQNCSINLRSSYSLANFTISNIEIIDTVVDTAFYIKRNALPDASYSAKGAVQIGSGLVCENGILSSNAPEQIQALKEEFEGALTQNDNHIFPVWDSIRSSNSEYGSITVDSENETITLVSGGANKKLLIPIDLTQGHTYTISFKISNSVTSANVYKYRTVNPPDVDLIQSLTYANGKYTGTFTAPSPNCSINVASSYKVSGYTIDEIEIIDTDIDMDFYVRLDRIKWDKTDNPALYTGKEFITFDKCLCVGDSLTAGVFNHNDGGTEEYVTISKYSYPAQMTKLFGLITTNKGTGGVTAQGWYNLHSSDNDLGGHDVCVIALGANDALQSVSKSETKSALNQIVSLIKTANSNIKIFLCTLLPAYYVNDTAHNNTNDAIKEVVSENTNCYLIDLTQYSICNAGTKYAQGHLTALGYMQEACEIVAMASYIIRQSDKDEFRYIQFINTNYSHS